MPECKTMKKLMYAMCRLWRRRLFKKNGRLASGFTCGPHAHCYNEQGHPDAIQIDRDTEILGTLCVMGPGRIRIGSNTTIRYNTTIESIVGVEIGRFVIISNNVVITDNNNHPTDPAQRLAMSKSGFYGERWHWRHADCKPVVIGDNVWIGRNAVVLKGVSIGAGAVVGCNAVVTEDVPPYSIVAGNPARVVKRLVPPPGSLSEP